VAFALAAAIPFPAAAQQAQALVGGEILDSATLTNDADMDFGTIVPSASAGTVVMTPSAPATCTTSGGLVHSGACKAAAFSGLAFFHADLRAQRPNGDRIDLTGPGGATMRLEDFSFGSASPTVSLGANGANHRFRIDATDGSYTFYVGGTLRVGAVQAPGIYTGTFDIRITYN
jgi:hypothetical protein